jgi:hypothetical protein
MKPTLYTATGECVTPGRELGKGGEGAVYDIEEFVDSVAKIYHTPPPALKQDKLAFMAATADAQLLNYVAWPQATLHGGRGGKVIGFMMPKVSGKEPIHMIYSPAHRRQRYPHCAWDFLLYVARNIASSFATIHEHGHVVGDVNQNSFMVGRDSKVVLIDSDSFQINANGTLHLCEVGVSHFTSPELQTLSSFVGFERTANHDNFGLALLIFHVLFGGRHPYSGVPLISDAGNALETDIAHFRYAYASDNQRRGLKPPPRSIPLSMLPGDVEAMFQQAFTESGVATGRPTAKAWVAALDLLRQWNAAFMRSGRVAFYVARAANLAINDVPAQSDFYSSANGRLLNDLVRDAREPEKVALLQKVWRQRLSYRLVRSAEESKIALSSAAETRASLPFISDELATLISQQRLENALSQPLARILEQVQLALDNAQEKPDVIYLTGGSARSPLIKKALAEQLPGIPIAGGDDFGSVTAGLARWAEVVFR